MKWLINFSKLINSNYINCTFVELNIYIHVHLSGFLIDQTLSFIKENASINFLMTALRPVNCNHYHPTLTSLDLPTSVPMLPCRTVTRSIISMASLSGVMETDTQALITMADRASVTSALLLPR